MKKILIAAGALVVIGASAGAGYYVMSRPAEANVEREAPYVDPVKDPRYVELDPLVLPIVEDGRIRYHMFVRLSLEVDGKDAANTVLSQKIRLHHAIYMALYGQPLEAPGGDMLDVERIKTVARGEAQKVIGRDLIQSVQIQQAVPGQT